MQKLITISLMVFLLLGLVGTGLAAEYDMGGETLRIVTSGYSDMFDDNPELALRKEMIEEEFNVKIEMVDVHWSERVDVYSSSIMAGDPVGDVFEVDLNYRFPQLASEGLFLPLNDVLDDEYYNSILESHKNVITDYGNLFGNQLVFSRNGSIDPNVDNYQIVGIYWNKTLFEREGLPNLYELRDEGEWNWENLLDIAEMASKDTDGDGTNDQWGIGPGYPPAPAWWAWSFIPLDIIPATNDAKMIHLEDGEYYFDFTHERALKSLEFTKDLTQFGDLGEEEAAPLFYNGNLAMMIANIGSFETIMNECEDEIGLVPMAKGPDVENYISPAPKYEAWALPLNLDLEPKAVIEVVSALFKHTDDYRNMDNYYDDILSSYAEFAHDRESIESLKIMHETQVIYPRFRPLIEEDAALHTPMHNIIWEEASPVSTMESFYPTIQALLDDIINQGIVK